MTTDVLEGLNDRDRRALYERLSFEYAKGSVNDPLSAEEQDTWDAIHEMLRIGGAREPLKSMFAKEGRNAFTRQVEVLSSYLDTSIGVTLPRLQRNSLRRSVIQCLVRYLRRRGRDLTPREVLKSMDLVASAVEASFPGYAEAKLLHLIVMAAVAA